MTTAFFCIPAVPQINDLVEEDFPMTLVVACAGPDEIIMAADRKILQGGSSGYVSVEGQKLLKLGRNRVLACAGSPQGYLIADALGLGSRDLEAPEYYELMSEYYRDHRYALEASVLLAGFVGKAPEMVSFTLSSLKPSGPEPRYGIAAVGVHKEMALLLLAMWNTPSLTSEQRKVLVCAVVRLIEKHDPRVGGGVDIVRVTAAGTENIEDGSLYDTKALLLVERLGKLLEGVC